MKLQDLREGNPFDFVEPEVKFKKLDDLPKGRPHTPDEIMKAMHALHKMVHAQAAAYGGKHGKLLPVGITEEVSEGEQKRRQELYKKWRELINMSAESIEKFKQQQTKAGRKDPKKYPGLKPQAAKKIGISSGVQSAEWIAKMKKTPVKDWTPEMWKWAGKQVSFVSRMLGNPGPLRDENGEPTRKLLSLLIWGHNPR
jgi:coenzyme F420-reducing hydrogenase alpha subunit